MQNGLGLTLNSSVIFKVKFVVEGLVIITEKIHKSILKSFVEIKFEICRIYKAQCGKEKTPVKFTKQLIISKMLIA